jgi:nicotinate-nucleotide adenylyltransferase
VRVALFGGTFDPIHLAHVRVAAEAADRFHFDRVLFVTSANPPHKTAESTAAYEHRHSMVEIACAADPRFEPSRLEDHPGRSYSHDTILRAKAELPATDELFFLIGADAFADIGTWHRSAEVLAMVEFVVVSRPGYRYPIPEGARVHRLESLALQISSSEIRRHLDEGRADVDLPPGVLDYIRQHSLYQ